MLSRRGGQRVREAPRRAPLDLIRDSGANSHPPHRRRRTMGCTASAPTTISLNGSTTDKNIQFTEESIEIPSETIATIEAAAEQNIEMDSNMLPSSSVDNIAETANLHVNHSMASLQSEKELQVTGHVNDIEPDPDKIEEHKSEEVDEVDKIPKLEKFIDKVFELNPKLIDIPVEPGTNTELEKTIEDTKENEIDTKQLENTETKVELNESESKENLEIELNESEEIPEDTSPSPSKYRATRWEALADIVAELPPSLAIDPVTGQIYSLTK